VIDVNAKKIRFGLVSSCARCDERDHRLVTRHCRAHRFVHCKSCMDHCALWVSYKGCFPTRSRGFNASVLGQAEQALGRACLRAPG
jgi:hypothetical protein